MFQFLFGFILGSIFVAFLVITVPLLLKPVQKELVAQGYGFYSLLIKDFILKECK